MSTMFEAIKRLLLERNVRISAHAFLRCSNRNLSIVEIVKLSQLGEPIDQYPDHHAGPALLVLMFDEKGPIHAVWGLEKGSSEPAVLVTAYRPSPEEWENDYRTRRK